VVGFSGLPYAGLTHRPPHAPAPRAPFAAQTGGFNPETDEELEDAQGNVYNKKTYEDLRRQGLI
jgi:hypothetical protein